MYQIKIGADCAHRDWIIQLYDDIKPFVTSLGGLIVEENDKGRINLAIAVERNGKPLKTLIKEQVCRLFLSTVKRGYLCEAIEPFTRNRYFLRVYLHILMGIYQEEEGLLLQEGIKLTNHFALDGYYYFRMQSVRKKWDELIDLTVQNGDLLQEDASFSILLKYMLSCLPAKTKRVFVDYDLDKYYVKCDGFRWDLSGTEDVVLLLVELSPAKIELSKSAIDTDLDEKILRIFDAKIV